MMERFLATKKRVKLYMASALLPILTGTWRRRWSASIISHWPTKNSHALNFFSSPSFYVAYISLWNVFLDIIQNEMTQMRLGLWL